MSFDVALGYFSGLIWIAPQLSGSRLLRTVLLVHICDAVVCRVFAGNHGYSRRLWTALGFAFGIWAVAASLLLPNRRAPVAKR